MNKLYFVFWLLIAVVHANGANDGFVLITILYNEVNEKRLEEYRVCLNQNLQHNLIKKVHVIYDVSKDDGNNKLLQHLQNNTIEMTYVTGRVTYGYCFDLVNHLYPGEKIILCNGDIYCNETLSLLMDYDLTGKFLALTRWNVKKDGSLEISKLYDKFGQFSPEFSAMSQDAWIFSAPIRKFDDASILMGTFHCDGRIAFQANKSGLNVVNPCLSIQCCHLHLSGIRNYEKENWSVYKDSMMRVYWSSL